MEWGSFVTLRALTAPAPPTSFCPMSVNKVILVGRLGQDPELKNTPSGAQVANFSVATSESWNDKSGQRQERTEWHRIVAWGKTAELCSRFLSKGRQVYLEGSLQTRSWDDQNGQKRYTTEVRAQTVQFLGSRSDSAGAEAGAYAPAQNGGMSNEDSQASMGGQSSGFGMGAASTPSSAEPSFTEDDVPF